MDILLRAQHVQYPSAWEQVESQADNLQLCNVDPASIELAALVSQVQASGKYKVLKVCQGTVAAQAAFKCVASR